MQPSQAINRLAMDCDQQGFTPVWRRHQLLSEFLSYDRLPPVSHRFLATPRAFHLSSYNVRQENDLGVHLWRKQTWKLKEYLEHLIPDGWIGVYYQKENQPITEKECRGMSSTDMVFIFCCW